jgi:MoaA/NifB/PqqE/SkfB family radical SAM enzyme
LIYSRFEPLKVLAQYDKLVDLSRGNICLPQQLMVYPSNKCNMNCGHCIMKKLRADNKMLSFDTLNKLVSDCVRLNIKLVNIAGGGEPLTNPYTFSFIQRLHDVGIQIGLNTNGLALLNTMKVDFLRISVDAASKATYKAVHGVDDWAKLNSNLKNYKKHKELGLAFLVSHLNAHEVEDFCKWAQQFDYDFLHIRPAYWPEHDTEIKAAMAGVMAQAAKLEKYRAVNLRTDKFESEWQARPFTKCRATPLKAVLTADGSFIQCQDKFHKFGDYNTQSFEEIWFSEEHRSIIECNDLTTCPRCVEGPTNDIIENCIMDDKLKINLF